jgi:hypothetical protein
MKIRFKKTSFLFNNKESTLRRLRAQEGPRDTQTTIVSLNLVARLQISLKSTQIDTQIINLLQLIRNKRVKLRLKTNSPVTFQGRYPKKVVVRSLKSNLKLKYWTKKTQILSDSITGQLLEVRLELNLSLE